MHPFNPTPSRMAFLARCRAMVLTLALVAVNLLAGSFTADAASIDSANQLFDAGKFADARKEYEQLAATGPWTPNLFYNLGNTEFRLGDPGRAILNYERTLALQPNHPEALRNLELARSQTGARLQPLHWIDRAFPAWTANVFTLLGTVALWVAVFGLVYALIARRAVSVGLWAVIVCALLTTIYAGVAVWRSWENRTLAVITAKNIVAHLAPADRAGVAEALPPGSRVRVLSERGDWIYCALPGQGLGWLRSDTLEKIRLSTS